MGTTFSIFAVSANQGLPDTLLWELVQTEARLLITTDKGFSQHRNLMHHGILIVRLRQPNEGKIHQRVMRVIGEFGEGQWDGLMVL